MRIMLKLLTIAALNLLLLIFSTHSEADPVPADSPEVQEQLEALRQQMHASGESSAMKAARAAVAAAEASCRAAEEAIPEVATLTARIETLRNQLREAAARRNEILRCHAADLAASRAQLEAAREQRDHIAGGGDEGVALREEIKRARAASRAVEP